MNKYLKLKEKQRAELERFPITFAFSKAQLKEAMQELEVEKTSELLRVGPGGIIRKEDSDKFTDLIERHDRELQQAIEQDETGERFIKDMFRYELGNHEYIVTGRLNDTLDALGLTPEEVKENEKLKNGLDQARKEYLKQYETG